MFHHMLDRVCISGKDRKKIGHDRPENIKVIFTVKLHSIPTMLIHKTPLWSHNNIIAPKILEFFDH